MGKVCGWALNVITSIFTRRRLRAFKKKQKRRQKKKEPGQWSDAVTSQDSLQPWSWKRLGTDFPLTFQRKCSPVLTWISQFQSPNLWGDIFLHFLNIQCVCGHLLQHPQKTNALGYKWKADNLMKAIFRNIYMIALHKSIFYFIDIIWKYKCIYQNLSNKFYKSREFKFLDPSADL